MRKMQFVVALSIIAALALAPATQARHHHVPAVKIAKIKLRRYAHSHRWVHGASLRRCHHHHGRLVCGVRISGGRDGSPIICSARAIVYAKHHRRQVKMRFGKCRHAPAAAPAPATATPAEKVKLHAHLDPSYTRNPLDPFEVTYAYSASATQEPVGASISTEEPAPLPSGVLALYSDGSLECAVNVGGSATGSACPVDYGALGEHEVTTIYTSGEESATETETESIEPLPSTALISATYSPLAGPALRRENASGTWFAWELGSITVEISADPPTAIGPAIPLKCFGAPPKADALCLPTSGSTAFAGPFGAGPFTYTTNVYGTTGSQCAQIEDIALGETAPSFPASGTVPTEWSSTTPYVRTFTNASGYISDEATASLHFGRPEVTSGC